MKLILSPSTRKLYTVFAQGESGHKYYLLPTDDPGKDLAELFGLPATTVQKHVLPKVMVYRRPPQLDGPEVSVLPIITAEELNGIQPGLAESISSYFAAAQERWLKKETWERKRKQIISLFLKAVSEDNVDLATAATMLASTELRTGVVMVRTKTATYPAMRIYTAVPKKGGEEKKVVQRGEYWHVSALPLSRPPIRVSRIDWEVGLAQLDNGESAIGMYASLQSVLGVWRSYRAAEEAEQKAKEISRGIAAAASVYGQSVAIPVATPPYGLVVIRHMPPTTYDRSAPSPTIRIMWTNEWKERYA